MLKNLLSLEYVTTLFLGDKSSWCPWVFRHFGIIADFLSTLTKNHFVGLKFLLMRAFY